MARGRIGLPTQGFSGLCSTTELPRHNFTYLSKWAYYIKKFDKSNFFYVNLENKKTPQFCGVKKIIWAQFIYFVVDQKLIGICCKFHIESSAVKYKT